MTRSFFLFFCFCLITICSQAQISTPSSPDWVQLMYADSAELGPVMRAYDAYYTDHPFVKNQHTQYLKRWKRKTATYRYHFSDTRLSANQKQQLQQSEQNYVKRNRSALSRNNGANWSCVGPFDWDHEAADRSYAAGAAHVYTVESCAAAPEVLYAGTATAGVWKSTDYGQNWTNLTADRMVNKVVAIEIDPEIRKWFLQACKAVFIGQPMVAILGKLPETLGFSRSRLLILTTSACILHKLDMYLQLLRKVYFALITMAIPGRKC